MYVNNIENAKDDIRNKDTQNNFFRNARWL